MIRVTSAASPNGPVCCPLMAKCHSTARDARAPANTGEGGGSTRGAAGSLTTTASRIVITFSQVLQRIFRTFCLTFSSAMEYLVWQRSQTNFIRDFRQLESGPAYHRVFGRGVPLL